MAGVIVAIGVRVTFNLTGATNDSALLLLALAVGGGICGYCTMRYWCGRVRSSYWPLGLTLLLLALLPLAQMVGGAYLSGAWQRALGALTRTLSGYRNLQLLTTLLFAFTPTFLVVALARGTLCTCGELLPQRARKLTFLLLLHLLAISGYACANRVLIPHYGLCGAARLATLWFALLVGGALLRRWRVVLPLVIVAAALVWIDGDQCEAHLAGGTFSRLVHRDSGFARGAPHTINYTRRHSVAHYRDPDYQSITTLDGRPLLFGNRFHSARILGAYAPLLLNPRCERVALMGSEAALYAPLLHEAGVGELVMVGSDQKLVQLLTQPSESAGDSSNLTFKRRLSAAGSYDLIYLAPTPVWQRGEEYLFGRRYFKQCAARLNSGGLVALHLDARLLTPQLLATITRDFALELPYMQLWYTGGYDWLLIGGVARLAVEAQQALAFFERETVVRNFARAGVLSLPEALGSMVCDGAGLLAWMEQSGFESFYQFARRVPRLLLNEDPTTLVTPQALEPQRQNTLEWLVVGTMEPALYRTIRTRAQECGEARTLAARALWRLQSGRGDLGLTHAREAAQINPRDPLLTQLADALELEGRRRIALGEFKGGLKCYENLLSFAPGTALSHFGMAYCLRATGDSETAYLHFARAVAAAPEQLEYRRELAQAAVTVGEYAEADRQYEQILAREPQNHAVLFLQAKALAHKERPDRDFARAIKIVEELCVKSEWQNLEYAYGLADLYIDAGRVLEGMGLKRKLKAQRGEPGDAP